MQIVSLFFFFLRKISKTFPLYILEKYSETFGGENFSIKFRIGK